MKYHHNIINDGVGTQYIWQKCVVCNEKTNLVYMMSDIPVCYAHRDAPEFIEWLRINHPDFYRFETEQ